ncbi:hypothetical protein INS90_05990 [Trueperella pecoris]|uniref:Uncharacterized protein n=1 Tax=Trueperella pecoris TaxID=2733571 RepID=A0A7M1QXM4_9ACTO|nr:hypothetical protein [Trueperella pecoris]QOR46852.1 hypothetical protein INS90_05990 [Trueperella pecoris]
MKKQTLWGCTPAGRPAMLVAIPLGVLIGILLGVIFSLIRGLQAEDVVLYFVLMATMTAPIGIALAWAIVVDRSTLTGAIAHPEVSVESHWHRKAAQISFFALLNASGWGSAIAAALNEEKISFTLLAVALFSVVVFAVAYFIQKRRGA